MRASPQQPSKNRQPAADEPSYRWPPRIIFNTDGCMVFKYLKRRRADDVTEALETLAGTSVDVVSVNVGINDGLSWRGSAYGELWGQDDIGWYPDSGAELPSGEGVIPGASSELLQNNLAALVDDGHDVMQLYIDRARRVGLGIYASFRMNDAHDNMEHRWSDARRSQRKKDRPDLLIGSAVDPRTWVGYADEWRYTWQWDWAQREVRDIFLGRLRETLDRYDLDGIELDFLRHPPFFKAGQGFKNVSTMTEFMREARDAIRSQATRNRKTIRLAARVMASMDYATELGIDTEGWVGEGLVDAIVLASGHPTLENDVARAAAAAEASGVLVYAGFDSVTDTVSPQEGYERNPRTVTRAVALNGYQHGAAGVHLFNHDYASHRPGPVTDDEGPAVAVDYPRLYDGVTGLHDTDRFTKRDLETLRDLGDPGALLHVDRCYHVGGSEFPQQLPRKLPLDWRGAGPGHALRLTVEDDIADGLSQGRIKKTELRLRLTDHEESMGRIRCEVNGQPVDLRSARKLANSSGEEWLVVTNPPVRQGENTVLLVLRGEQPAQGADPLEPWPKIHQCEILVMCEDGSG